MIVRFWPQRWAAIAGIVLLPVLGVLAFISSGSAFTWAFGGFVAIVSSALLIGVTRGAMVTGDWLRCWTVGPRRSYQRIPLTEVATVVTGVAASGDHVVVVRTTMGEDLPLPPSRANEQVAAQRRQWLRGALATVRTPRGSKSVRGSDRSRSSYCLDTPEAHAGHPQNRQLVTALVESIRGDMSRMVIDAAPQGVSLPARIRQAELRLIEFAGRSEQGYATQIEVEKADDVWHDAIAYLTDTIYADVFTDSGALLLEMTDEGCVVALHLRDGQTRDTEIAAAAVVPSARLRRSDHRRT